MKASLSNPATITKYNKTVRAVVNTLLLSRHLSSLPIDRDDLYQVGWVALIQCLPHFDSSRGVKFETYASRVIVNAVNKEIMHYGTRRMNRLNVDVANNVTVGETTDSQMMDELITTAQATLSRSEQSVFWKRFTDGKTFEDIGKEHGFSRETARKIFNTSLRKVMKAVA